MPLDQNLIWLKMAKIGQNWQKWGMVIWLKSFNNMILCNWGIHLTTMAHSIVKISKLNHFWQNYERFLFFRVFSLVKLLHKLQTALSELSWGVEKTKGIFVIPIQKDKNGITWFWIWQLFHICPSLLIIEST